MPRRTRYRATTSFEFDTQPVLTDRQEIISTNAELAAKSALRMARRTFPNQSPRSFVVCLEVLDKVEVAVTRPRSHFKKFSVDDEPI